MTCKLFNKILQHRCFPVKFATLLRTPILKSICERLLLLLAKEDEQNLMEEFTWEQKKKIKQTTLLSLWQQSQDLGLLLLQGLDYLTLMSLRLLILHNELVMLPFPSFTLIVFIFLNSRSCSSFSRRKPTTSKLHLLLWALLYFRTPFCY